MEREREGRARRKWREKRRDEREGKGKIEERNERGERRKRSIK